MNASKVFAYFYNGPKLIRKNGQEIKGDKSLRVTKTMPK